MKITGLLAYWNDGVECQKETANECIIGVEFESTDESCDNPIYSELLEEGWSVAYSLSNPVFTKLMHKGYSSDFNLNKSEEKQIIKFVNSL